MKRNGFTLVEMLVVVSIVVLLMGFMVAGISAAREQAKKAKARAEVAELTKAWNSYWKTYQKWPQSFIAPAVPGGGTKYMTVEMDAAAMAILQGTDGGADNPQKLKFSSISVDGAFLDPWGNPYRVNFEETATEGLDWFQTSVGFPMRKRYAYGYE